MKGRKDGVTSHISMVDVRKDEEEEGWFTVRRARSRFSPASSGSQGSIRNREQVILPSKAKNRYKMPSSAVSMPSLFCESADEKKEDETEDIKISRPPIEKSASSSSIIRHKDARVSRLGNIDDLV